MATNVFNRRVLIVLPSQICYFREYTLIFFHKAVAGDFDRACQVRHSKRDIPNLNLSTNQDGVNLVVSQSEQFDPQRFFSFLYIRTRSLYLSENKKTQQSAPRQFETIFLPVTYQLKLILNEHLVSCQKR